MSPLEIIILSIKYLSCLEINTHTTLTLLSL